MMELPRRHATPSEALRGLGSRFAPTAAPMETAAEPASGDTCSRPVGECQCHQVVGIGARRPVEGRLSLLGHAGRPGPDPAPSALKLEVTESAGQLGNAVPSGGPRSTFGAPGVHSRGEH
jgi:hypothetical protein